MVVRVFLYILCGLWNLLISEYVNFVRHFSRQMKIIFSVSCSRLYHCCFPLFNDVDSSVKGQILLLVNLLDFAPKQIAFS